jgi:competence ComEA-like helix-hairpin-helix protein
MSRRAWAGVFLSLLMAAGFFWIALHWQGNPVQYVRETIKPVTSIEPYTLPGGTVDVNTADFETLRTLDGISKSQIEALLTDRAENGAFDYPEDLISVKGIGEKTLLNIYDQLDYSGNEPGN